MSGPTEVSAAYNEGASSNSTQISTVITPGQVPSVDHLQVMGILVRRTATDPGVLSTPAGWTKVGSDTWINNTIRAAVYYKIAESSEPASYEIDWTNGASWEWFYAEYANENPFNIVEASASQANASANTSVDALTVTTVTPNDRVLCIYAADGASGAQAISAAPSGFTIDHNAVNGTVTCGAIGVCSKVFASPGATGTQTATIAQSRVSASFTLAITNQTAALAVHSGQADFAPAKSSLNPVGTTFTGRGDLVANGQSTGSSPVVLSGTGKFQPDRTVVSAQSVVFTGAGELDPVILTASLPARFSGQGDFAPSGKGGVSAVFTGGGQLFAMDKTSRMMLMSMGQ